MFDEENLISLAIFALFFSRNFHIIFFAKLSHYLYTKIFALFFREIITLFLSRNFRIIFYWNFCIFSRNRLKRNFAKIFAFLRKWSEMVAKNAIFPFRWKPGGGHNSPNFAWLGLFCTVNFVDKCFHMTELVS